MLLHHSWEIFELSCTRIAKNEKFSKFKDFKIFHGPWFSYLSVRTHPHSTCYIHHDKLQGLKLSFLHTVATISVYCHHKVYHDSTIQETTPSIQIFCLLTLNRQFLLKISHHFSIQLFFVSKYSMLTIFKIVVSMLSKIGKILTTTDHILGENISLLENPK